MLANLNKFKGVHLAAVIAAFLFMLMIPSKVGAQSVTPGPYVPNNYKSVSTTGGADFTPGSKEDDLVCEIENASKVRCRLDAGNASTTCIKAGANRPGGSCYRRDYYYNPVKSAQIGRDVFEADNGNSGGQTDAQKNADWGFVVFPLTSSRTEASTGNYSDIVLTKDYRQYSADMALGDTISQADEAIKKEGPAGICSVLLNKEGPVECTIGGVNNGNKSKVIGSKVSVASQKDYKSGVGEFRDTKGGECGGGALNFILCPIKDLLSTVNEAVLGLITKGLVVQTGGFADPSSPLRALFDKVLIVSNGLFALIFIIIVFGNTLSLGIDAYTIKKALPRLVIAVILAQFSYFIAGSIIEIGNVLSQGVLALLTSEPLKVTGLGSTVGEVASILLEILFLLISLVAILVGIFVLALRQIIIVGLMITGPLAFAAWILPNTEKIFKFWISNLVKLSLMGPIIVGLLAGSFVLQEAVRASEGNWIVQLGGAALPIIALLYLPKTFKWSGSLMASTGGKMADFGANKSKGAIKSSAKEGKIASGINKGADKLMDTPFGKGVTRTPMLGTAVQKNIGARAKRIESKQNLENLPGAQLEKMASQGHKGAKEVVQKKYNEELSNQEARAARGQDVDATKLVKLRKALGGSENVAQRETRRQAEASTLARAVGTYAAKFPTAPLPEISYKTGKAGTATTTSTQERQHYFEPPAAPGAAANRVIAPAPPPNTPPTAPLPFVPPAPTQLPAIPNPVLAAPSHDDLENL